MKIAKLSLVARVPDCEDEQGPSNDLDLIPEFYLIL